jgi:hypothetical protein
MNLDLISHIFGIICILVTGYIIWNQLRKQEKLEDIIEQQNVFIEELNKLMVASEIRIKEIDQRGLFESDDEIGWFFSNIKDIQNKISQFIIR